MPDDRLPKDELGTEPGLAGGPGPNPPGFDDGTPRILSDGSPGRAVPGAAKPRDAEVQDREGGPVERREPSGAPEPERE
jgi:hypothetical protein